MTKESIAYYTDTRVSLSLRNLVLQPSHYLEDIFDAVEDSANFQELTTAFAGIIAQPLQVDRVTPRYIRYKSVDPLGNVRFLKVKVQEVIENG